MTDFPLPVRLPPVAVPAAASRRWIAVLALSILLHLLVLGWGSDSLRIPAPHAAPQPLLEAALLAPPAPVPSPTPPVAAPARPAAPATARPRPKPRPPVPAPAATAITPPAEFPAPDSAYSVAAEPLPPVIDTGHAPEPPAPGPAEASAGPHYRIDPPPSVTLKYDVEAWRQGQRVYGHGSIAWHSDGGNYRIRGDAGILFFSVLSFTSEGVIDDFGVAPVLYNEKRFRKSATNTHFQRERNLISFSASTASYPRQGGEQDRASVIWQLAGIGRGDGGRFVAGADIDLFVAGVRDAETWRIHVVGQEQIEIDGQPTPAWHVVRAPRPGSYDQKIDIWLAPDRQWYPVKLRYTEASGDYLDLLLSNLKPPQPPAAVADTPAADNPATSHEWIN